MDRDQRNRLILAVLMTVMALALIYTMGISALSVRIQQETRKLTESQSRLRQLGNEMRLNLDDALRAQQDADLIEHWESRLAPASAYKWLLGQLELVASTNGVVEFALGEVSAAPHAFPPDLGYGGIQGSVFGVGAYQQLGQFVADFENAFPFNEVIHLNMDAFSAGIGVMRDDANYPVLGMKLDFRGCAREAVF